MKSPLFVTLLSSVLLAQSSLPAAMLIFREGDSPNVSYTTAGVNIRSDNPTVNQQSGPGNIVLGNVGTTGADIRAIFSFNLSAIGAIGSATIDSVTLSWRGTADSSISTTLQIDLFALTRAFGETTATWNSYDGTNAWTTAGGDFSGSLLNSQSGNPNNGVSTSSGNTTWTFISTANFINAAQSAFDSGGQTLYLIAKLNDESTTSRRIFQILGDENVTVNLRPTLTINYTPVPETSTSLLLCLGLGLLTFGTRWSQRQAL